MANHPGRVIWYAALNWILLLGIFLITASIPPIAKTNLSIMVLILAHLGIVPMLTHHFLRKHDGDHRKGAWQAGIAFAMVGLGLDGLAFGYYFGQGTSVFIAWTTWTYFALRLLLAPITARWIEAPANPK